MNRLITTLLFVLISLLNLNAQTFSDLRRRAQSTYQKASQYAQTSYNRARQNSAQQIQRTSDQFQQSYHRGKENLDQNISTTASNLNSNLDNARVSFANYAKKIREDETFRKQRQSNYLKAKNNFQSRVSKNVQSKRYSNSSLREIALSGGMLALKNFPIYDPERGKIMTADNFVRSDLKDMGMDQNSDNDLSQDPLGTTFLLVFDDEYFYEARIYPDGHGNYLSINDLHEKKDVEPVKNKHKKLKNALNTADSDMIDEATRELNYELNILVNSNREEEIIYEVESDLYFSFWPDKLEQNGFAVVNRPLYFYIVFNKLNLIPGIAFKCRIAEAEYLDFTNKRNIKEFILYAGDLKHVYVEILWEKTPQFERKKIITFEIFDPNQGQWLEYDSRVLDPPREEREKEKFGELYVNKNDLRAFTEVETEIKSDGKFVDNRDGKVYDFVNIGNISLMVQNLDYATEDSWYYNNNPEFGKIMGRLYAWKSANVACPEGWRLMTLDDFGNNLNEFLQDKIDIDNKVEILKAVQGDGWDYKKISSLFDEWPENFVIEPNNLSGLNIKPAGIKTGENEFNRIGMGTGIWFGDKDEEFPRILLVGVVLDEFDFSIGSLSWFNPNAARYSDIGKGYAFSCRCVKDR